MDYDVMIELGNGSPEHALTHKGCPRCCGSRKIRYRVGNRDFLDDCHFYGATYKIKDRMLAMFALEKELKIQES